MRKKRLCYSIRFNLCLSFPTEETTNIMMCFFSNESQNFQIYSIQNSNNGPLTSEEISEAHTMKNTQIFKSSASFQLGSKKSEAESRQKK